MPLPVRRREAVQKKVSQVVDIRFDTEYESAEGGAFNSESQGNFSQEISQDEFISKSVPTSKCPDCGRSFNNEALGRHIKVCKKVFFAKRKVFDAAKRRAEGTDLAAFNKANAKTRTPAASRVSAVTSSGSREVQAAYANRDNKGSGAPQTNQMPKWKRDSILFRQAMKAARDYESEKKAADAHPPPKIASRSSSISKAPVPTRMAPRTVGPAAAPSRAAPTHASGAKAVVTKPRVVQRSTTSTRPVPSPPSQPVLDPYLEILPAEVDPSFLKCPHCSRSFNEKAAERHIPLCKGTINKPTRLVRGSGVPCYSTNHH